MKEVAKNEKDGQESGFSQIRSLAIRLVTLMFESSDHDLQAKVAMNYRGAGSSNSDLNSARTYLARLANGYPSPLQGDGVAPSIGGGAPYPGRHFEHRNPILIAALAQSYTVILSLTLLSLIKLVKLKICDCQPISSDGLCCLCWRHQKP